MACRTWCDYTGTIPTKEDPDSRLDDWVVNVSDWSFYLKSKVLWHVFLGETFTPPSEFWVSCHSTTSSDATPGTELSGSNYGRVQVTFQRGSTDDQLVNVAAVTSGSATADWDAIKSLCVHDAQTGGNYLGYGNLTSSLTILQNQSFNIPAGNLILDFYSAP